MSIYAAKIEELREYRDGLVPQWTFSLQEWKHGEVDHAAEVREVIAACNLIIIAKDVPLCFTHGSDSTVVVFEIIEAFDLLDDVFGSGFVSRYVTPHEVKDQLRRANSDEAQSKICQVLLDYYAKNEDSRRQIEAIRTAALAREGALRGHQDCSAREGALRGAK